MRFQGLRNYTGLMSPIGCTFEMFRLPLRMSAPFRKFCFWLAKARFDPIANFTATIGPDFKSFAPDLTSANLPGKTTFRLLCCKLVM
jgi:hypothetical protein